MELPQSSSVKIQYLDRLFDNTSECNKYFWFQAILSEILHGHDELTYEKLINEMIVEAWYMVTEFHLSLGPNAILESLIYDIQKISGMSSTEKKINIRRYLQSGTDKEIEKKKKLLIRYVPYRLQAPFITTIKGAQWEISKEKLIKNINQQPDLMYYFGKMNGMQTCIYIEENWYDYFRENQEIVKGWLNYNMILYLQKRNPSVPGIADKLFPPEKRNLNKATKYWKVLLKRHPLQEIYGHEIMDGTNVSIDHFVPWSYVAHDEFWNLHPTTRSINSQKSNHLPDWNTYFQPFARLEYISYKLIYSDESVRREFKNCEKDYLNNLEIRSRLYREGQDFPSFAKELEGVMLPIYQSAQSCGFTSWVYQKA